MGPLIPPARTVTYFGPDVLSQDQQSGLGKSEKLVRSTFVTRFWRLADILCNRY